jgi:zinc transport system substrate-binding protein
MRVCRIGFSIAWLLATFAVTTAAQAELRVVATSKPIHALVAQVMNGVGTPSLLVDGTSSPHSYALKPSDALKAAQADVLFRVSENLEPFTVKLIRALPQSVTVATLSEATGVKLLQRRVGGPFDTRGAGASHGIKHASHKHGDAADSPYDAHIWLDPDNAKAMATAIAATLGERAPGDASRFKVNAEALSVRLDRLSAALAADIAPVSGRPFVVLHDAYQYFERRFGLNAFGSIMVDPDEQPSARRIVELRRKVAGADAVCVFAEPYHQRRIVQSVTEGTSARTAVLDPEGLLLDPGPELYFTLMQQLAASIKGCLSTQA